LLFPSNELGFFNGVLPVDHKFSLVTVCDVAFGGGDSVSMPIGLQDESTGDVYIIDWYFNSMGVSVTVPGVVDMLIKYGIMEVTFEKNNGGQMFADKVQEELKKRQYICSCNTKPAPNNISKEDKIKGCEGEIKNKLRFLDSTKHDKSLMGDVTYYERSPQYERALSELTTFVTIGKNDHDDAADSIAQLVIKAFGTFGKSEVRVLDRYIYGF
jgi:predicted phage terminase large subunit-like protein